jgi:hypothetical protein
MPDTTKPPALFWIISGISLLWYLFGSYQFYGSLVATPEGMKPYIEDGRMTQAYADVLLSLPAWVKAAFGIATLSGVVASICLLLRKKIAAPLFFISLIGALCMYLYMYVLSGKASVLPTSDFIIAACVVIVTLFMIWFSRKKRSKGYLT